MEDENNEHLVNNASGFIVNGTQYRNDLPVTQEAILDFMEQMRADFAKTLQDLRAQGG